MVFGRLFGLLFHERVEGRWKILLWSGFMLPIKGELLDIGDYRVRSMIFPSPVDEFMRLPFMFDITLQLLPHEFL